MIKEILIKTLLIFGIIFILVLIIYVSVKIFYVIKNKNQSSNSLSVFSPSANKFDSLVVADTSQSIQTKFFRESAQHSLDIVKGKEPVGLQDINFKGKEIMDTLKFLNDDARSNIYIAIQYMMVSRPDAEELMRQMSYKEEIPMWMVIIRQAMMQTISNINFNTNSNSPLTVSFSKSA